MFDECITKRCSLAVIEYLQLLDPPVEGFFLLDFMGSKDRWTTNGRRC